MIIILFGGYLGNHMFQYALGRHLSLLNNQPLLLNNTRYGEIDTAGRSFNLDKFNIADTFINPEFLTEFTKKHRSFLEKRILAKTFFYKKNYYKHTFITEPASNNQKFDPIMLTYPFKDVHIRGFWQSEKYFKDIRDVIVDELKVITPINEQNQKHLDNIKNTNSVSIHFRMTDNVATSAGKLSLDYYQQAIKIITKEVANPTFFIFSDNMNWIKKNFFLDYPAHYIESNPDYEDMRLMSNCQHHIIANSTFSWWGAWLSTNPNKIVIAPEKFSQKSDKINPDYYPESWILIK